MVGAQKRTKLGSLVPSSLMELAGKAELVGRRSWWEGGAGGKALIL